MHYHIVLIRKFRVTNMPASTEPKCKPHVNTKPYARKPKGTTAKKDAPKTSAKKPPKYLRENLTLHDWLTVVRYHDSHQPISQQDVVKHFSARPEGALIFTKSSLSCHLSAKGRKEDQD